MQRAQRYSARTIVAALVLVMAGSLAGKSETGRLTGQVSDPSGRPVPGAAVTLIRSASPPRTVKSDVSGQYQFRNVDASNYTVQADARGVARFEVSGVEIAGGQLQSLNAERKPEFASIWPVDIPDRQRSTARPATAF